MNSPVANPTVAVIGSLNVDMLLSVPRLPEAGSTIAATNWQTRYGGKGANQALAATRQGAIVSLIGCVGNDAYGPAYLDALSAEGINTAGVRVREDSGTGSAFVFINPAGENSIVCLGAANSLLSADDVQTNENTIATADIVLCQMETAVEATITALRLAAAHGKTTVLNPSPLNSDFPWGEAPVDFLIANDREAAALLGYFVQSTADAARIRATMADLGVSTLIITRGSEHTFAFSAHQALKVPPPAVQVVDTVGAGDTFAGAFAVHWAQTHNLLGALRKANIAGALATTRVGAQEAMPTREEVDSFGQQPASSSSEDAIVPLTDVEPQEFAEHDEQI